MQTDNPEIAPMLKRFCLADNLLCHDPYDIWMTPLGIGIKQLYNRHRGLGLLPAASLTLWDLFINNKFRLFYDKQEYPVVRALAALSLLNDYSLNNNKEALTYAKIHIDWLIANSCTDYAGLCWGIGFKWAADEGLDYNENTPFTTHTPYALEAIHSYVQITGDQSYKGYIKSIWKYYVNDVQIMFEDEDSMATSYGPSKDRLITNAVSYTLYAYSLFLKYVPEQNVTLKDKIKKLYNFIVKKQLQDGSWLYEPDSDQSFIDCFHSCFILKNIYKANQINPLPNYEKVVGLGYDYIKNNFYDTDHKLFKRFTLSNKPSMVKFDLYDNAEVLNLAILLNDKVLYNSLLHAIHKKFTKGGDIYSVIDVFNVKRNKNTLRWAVMPYLYALSKMPGPSVD